MEKFLEKHTLSETKVRKIGANDHSNVAQTRLRKHLRQVLPNLRGPGHLAPGDKGFRIVWLSWMQITR